MFLNCKFNFAIEKIRGLFVFLYIFVISIEVIVKDISDEIMIVKGGSQEIHVSSAQKGASVIVDTARPDVTRFYVLDLLGNRIEFMEHENR